MEPIKLDIHTHLVPVDETTLAGVEGVSWDAAATRLVVDGDRIGVKSLFKPQALISWLDANAIDKAWISAPPPLYRQHLRENGAADWIDRLNRGLAGIAEGYADRLVALPHLPIEHPAVAEDVAARAIAAGRSAFSSPSGGAGRMLSDKAYNPLWRVLDAASAVVLFHPGESHDERLKPFYLANLLGNPYETTVAIAHLVFGSVLDRYPNITFCFAHGGGAAAMLAGRFEQGFRTDRPGIDTSLSPPRLIMRYIMVDCMTHDPESLRLAEAIFGSDHILFGSDWPFPMGLMQPHAQLAALGPFQRKRIFQENMVPFADQLALGAKHG